LVNRNKIKLLIITPTLQCGGSEKFVSLLCNHINTDTFSVCLLIINNANCFHKINNTAIEIIDLKKNRVLFSLPAIKKIVKYFKADIVFSTANHLNIYLAIFKNQFNANIKFIAREANIVSITSRLAKMPAVYELLIKKYYKRFDLIICQTAYMQQDLLKHYQISAAQTVIIENAVQEIADIPIQREREKAKKLYKFITVARLSEQKGIERLIHAVWLLNIPFNYFIIGEGNKRNELQKLIDELQLQERVFLAGQKEAPFNGLEDADLFLMGSYYEGLPNVLLEAGARGIPVVAFNAPGGIAKIITETENGLLIEDNNIIAFAEGINRALTTDFNRNKITEIIRKRFSLNKMIDAMESIFLKLAQKK
jgi:glycosyltransferase involved in cell wall biosynthesis